MHTKHRQRRANNLQIESEEKARLALVPFGRRHRGSARDFKALGVL